MLYYLSSIVNKILAHVIWKSFSFHFIKQTNKKSQHFRNLVVQYLHAIEKTSFQSLPSASLKIIENHSQIPYLEIQAREKEDVAYCIVTHKAISIVNYQLESVAKCLIFM